jgi:hypothetical protein
MKKLTTKLMIAAAALVAAASAASAQNMTAQIPFEFRVGNRVMAPGTYQVGLTRSVSSVPLFQLRNQDSGQQAVLLAQAKVDPRKAWAAEGIPKVEFACPSGRCALAELWDGYDSQAYSFHRPKLGKDEDAYLTVIPMQRDKGE